MPDIIDIVLDVVFETLAEGVDDAWGEAKHIADFTYNPQALRQRFRDETERRLGEAKNHA